MDSAQVYEVALDVRGDVAWRGIVAAGLLQHALALESQSLREGDKAHKTAFNCAANLTLALEGAPEQLGLLLSQMSSRDGALFAKALDGEKPRLESASLFDQLLIALNGVPRTAATGEIVQGLYLQTEPRDLIRAPGLAHAMAVAVGREWHPDGGASAEASRLEALMHGPGAELAFGGSAARKAIVFHALRNDPRINADLLAREKGDPSRNRTVANAMAHVMISAGRAMAFSGVEEDAAWRLGGILSIEAGEKLFFSDKVPAAARGQALAVIIARPEITSASFKTDNPWLTPALAEPIAGLYTQGYGNDASQSLPGLSLDNMVGFAMGIAPTLPKGQEWRDLWNGVDGDAVAARVAAGAPVTASDRGGAYDALTGISYYDRQQDVAAIVRQIKSCAYTDPPRVKPLPVIFFGENGPIKCPLFRVQSGVDANGRPEYAYVDNAGRKYDDIELDWTETNRLPPGKVYYPASDPLNRLIGDGKGGLVLARAADTPRTHHKVREALDTAAMVGCFAAGVTAVAVTGGTVALVAAGVGATGGGWMAYRSGGDVVDSLSHGLSPLSLDALGNYLGVIGGVAGLGAFAGVAARGAKPGATAASVIGASQKIAVVAGTAGLLQQGATLGMNWKDIPPETQTLELLKLLAFGGLALAGAARPTPAATPRPPTPPAPKPAAAAANTTASPPKATAPATPGPTMVTPPPGYAVGPTWTADWTSPKPPPGFFPPETPASSGQSGASATVDARAPAGSSRPPSGKQSPIAQKMAGDDGKRGGPTKVGIRSPDSDGIPDLEDTPPTPIDASKATEPETGARTSAVAPRKPSLLQRVLDTFRRARFAPKSWIPSCFLQ